MGPPTVCTAGGEALCSLHCKGHGLGILTRLLRGRDEPWDRSQVAEVALGALKASSGDPAPSEARDRLRAALTDLGYFGAADM
jgi:hypothetical protein